MNLMEFILRYIDECGQTASSPEERDNIEKGIRLYLGENGLKETSVSERHIRYVERHLKTIRKEDSGRYFACYETLMNVRQIVMNSRERGRVTPEERKALYGLMADLYDAGLGDRYVPAEVEIMISSCSSF